MTKSLFAFLIFILILAGCTNRNSISLEGNIKNKEIKKIYLTRIDVDTYVKIDSARIRKNGDFRFRFNATEPDFYQIGANNSDFITILTEPGEKIKLTFHSAKLYENYEVTGSAGSQKIKMLDEMLLSTIKKIDSLRIVYNEVSKSPDSAKLVQSINEVYLKLVKEQRNKNIEFILGNLSSFASIKALYQRIDDNTYVLYDPRDLQFLKLVSDTLFFHYPDSKQAKALKKNFEKEMNQMRINQIEKAAMNAPETKLDPNLKDINGNRISLSSLKGKIVLLAFWATTSELSIKENLALKELYKTYKSKGFEIYQINLDTDEAAWKKAVKFDELPWISVREDDPLNAMNARLYNVRSLPSNFLYDRNGEILSSGLHGKPLQIKLVQIFGN
jgi:thiol-disulfide isomerase/thioredoxin